MAVLQTHFCVLDIETSSHDIDGKPAVSWLSFGRIKMYSIQGEVIENEFFRDWSELIFVMQRIQRRFSPYEIVCYAHNLGFEFDFIIKNISRPTKMLSNSTRSIISGKIQDFNFLFKCSWKLSGYSLAKIGEMVGLPKLDGDYVNIFPHEEIPNEYIVYNERDCDIVAKYIIEMELKKWGNLRKIPLTKTGKVRKMFNDFYRLNEGKSCEWDLMPPDNCYEAIMQSFQGAITISNPMFTNIELVNIDSYDIKSSYPYSMLNEIYPYTIKKSSNLSKSQLDKKFWIAKIKFTNVKSKFSWQWLSISKMQDYCRQSSKFFNGKLICTDYMIRTMTNIDFESICDTYYFDEIEILEFYEMDKWGSLPTPYIETIKHFGKIKNDCGEDLHYALDNKHEFTEEELQNKDRDYSLSKNDYNSIYGMTVQKLVQPEYSVDDNFLWREIEKPYRYKEGVHMKRNFLFGVYILAYSRRNLLRAIVKNCPITFIYADTDSIKYMKYSDFVDTNERLKGEFAEIVYLKDLGAFEHEINYKEFKTLGAKKYCHVKNKSDIVNLTVAGLPKSKEYPIKTIEEFAPETNFKDCKLAKAYINNQNISYQDWESHEVIAHNEMTYEAQNFIEQNGIETNGGVVLYPTSYMLDMTAEDKFIVNEYQRLLPKFLKENEHLRRFFKYGKEI